MSASCRSCGAPIRWARTAKGRRMPLDPEPAADGNVQLGLIGGEEIAIVLGPADIACCQVDGVPLYRTHFSTCPDAASFRRGSDSALVPGEPKEGPVICAEP